MRTTRNHKAQTKMEISDSEILSRFRNLTTKEAGFKMLMEKYQQRLYWQIRRMVVNHEDADDVLQNTFVKIWNNLHKFQEQSQLFTWLYRIATNETLTFLSQKKKRMSASFDDISNELENQLTAENYFEGDEIQKKLQSAIATLPDKQKLVFNMRYYDELPYEEMSKVLGTSVGALKASYHHAVKKIEIFLTSD